MKTLYVREPELGLQVYTLSDKSRYVGDGIVEHDSSSDSGPVPQTLLDEVESLENARISEKAARDAQETARRDALQTVRSANSVPDLAEKMALLLEELGYEVD
jgi:hypothetical protein